MTEPVFILGGAQTDFARVFSREGKDISDMIGECVHAALASARVDFTDIESIHVGNAFAELQRRQGHLGAMVGQMVPELLGLPAMRHEGACASASLAVLAASAEIEAGRYDCVLVTGVEELRNVPGDVASANQNAAGWQGHEGIDCRFLWPAVFGDLAAVYEERHGLDRRHLNRIAEINYGNARRNPNAQTRAWTFDALAFTDDDRANPVIEPGTRRQDCGQITDGAATIVLASGRFAKEIGRDLSITPRLQGWGHRNGGLRYRDKIERSRGQDYIFPHVRQTITEAWARAGIHDIRDIDGIETHDCFTSTEYMAIDHFGLTAPGQSWMAIEAGDIELGGRMPINPSGGLIGGGHPVGATGTRMLLDACKQVTGEAGDYQVEGARRFATLNIGGSLGTVVSFIVGIDP